MGIFRAKRRIMGKYEPLRNPTQDEIIKGLADFDSPLTARNAWANALLAWAEEQSAAEFVKMRHFVFQKEIAINARDWVSRFPDETTELACLKQMAVMSELTKAMGGQGGERFEESYGPDIPDIVNKAYTSLVQGKSSHAA